MIEKQKLISNLQNRKKEISIDWKQCFSW